MDNKLEIRTDPPGKEQRIFLNGRLDAGGAGHLDDFLNSLVREGSYRLIVNMSGVHYMSSAGIRILVSQYKKIKNIGGLFVLEALSGAVSEVLNMVGMLKMLTEITPEPLQKGGMEYQYRDIGSYRFGNETLSDEQMTISLAGNPKLVLSSGFTAADNRKIKFRPNHYGLGIGAIGDGFEDCKSRYGEFIALGEALVYKPSDGSKVPDYVVRSGRFEPEINALYSIEADGNFSNRITFEPVGICTPVTLDELLSNMSLTSLQNKFVFLIIAESAGIVGMSLNAPPVEGKQLFEFPGIRENINFTTEPAYSRMLTVSLGFYFEDPAEPLRSFLRPAKPGSSAFIHAHTAVFPYQALPKNESSAGKLVLNLFENGIVQDVLHLIDDSREIIGLGSSSFRQGVAWIGKIS